MSPDFKKLYNLLDRALEGGLPVIASYLEKKIAHPVIIIDANGNIYYPEMAIVADKLAGFFKNIPTELQENAYYYNSAPQCLIYNVTHNTSVARVIVENLLPEKIEQTAAVISECELALKYYFSSKNQHKQDFGESLWENFFMSAGADIPNMLKLYEQKMNIDNYYFVSVIDVEAGAASLDWNILRSSMHEIMNKEHTEHLISIIAPDRLVTIVRSNPPKSPTENDPDWPGRELLFETKIFLENKLNITFSQGIGRSCRPSGLLKSYEEACIALALTRLTGEKQFIQYFSRLGVFSIIFSHDIATVKNYCLQVLGKLIEQDQEYGTDLIDTLRLLLDNSCSWTTTANQMYVHVNTVYYRMFKVEKLLEMDFSLFETRLHLLTAVRCWDALKMCGFIE